jgi:hypothetical protein
LSHAADYAILAVAKPFDQERDPLAYLTATPILLSDAQRQELEAIVRRYTSPQHWVTRAKIILAAAQGEGVRATARRLQLARGSVQRWRQRGLTAPATARVGVR